MRFITDLTANWKDKERTGIDLKDKKILWLLGKNARMPLNSIAKNVGLSRDAVAYRIKRLESAGILHHILSIVNVAQLGYSNYHILLRLKNPTKAIELEMIRMIRALPYVRVIIKYYGSTDFEVGVIAKSIEDFDTILTDIIGKTQNYLEEYEILGVTKSFRGGAFPWSFYREGSREFHPVAKMVPYKPDMKDMKILKILRDNARCSLVDISTKVGLSADAVAYRIKHLEQGNLILGYTPIISYTALGYQMYALLLQIQNLDKEKEKKLHDFFNSNETVLWAVKTVGRYNILAYICTQKEDDLHSTITALRNLFPEKIKQYESLLAYAEYKYTYAPDCLFEKGGDDEN